MAAAHQEPQPEPEEAYPWRRQAPPAPQEPHEEPAGDDREDREDEARAHAGPRHDLELDDDEDQTRGGRAHRLTSLGVLKVIEADGAQYLEWWLLRFCHWCLTERWALLQGGWGPRASRAWQEVFFTLELDGKACMDLFLLAQAGIVGRSYANKILWRLLHDFAPQTDYYDVSWLVSREVTWAREEFERPPANRATHWTWDKYLTLPDDVWPWAPTKVPHGYQLVQNSDGRPIAPPALWYFTAEQAPRPSGPAAADAEEDAGGPAAAADHEDADAAAPRGPQAAPEQQAPQPQPQAEPRALPSAGPGRPALTRHDAITNSVVLVALGGDDAPHGPRAAESQAPRDNEWFRQMLAEDPMQVDEAANEAGEAPQAPQAPRKSLNKMGKGLGQGSAASSFSRASGASMHSAASVGSAAPSVSQADLEQEEAQ